MLEMIISLAIIAVMFAVILPQFKNIQNSWASKQATAEAIQNGRILIDRLSRDLAKAAQITAVSDPCDTTGYIEFVGNDATTYRYDIGADNIVEFGPVGSLSDLAGPVSQLQFTCFDAQDLDTPITTPEDIRCVKVQTTLTNPGPGQDQTYTTSAYLRTNAMPDGISNETPFEFEPLQGKTPALAQIDSTHYLCAYAGWSNIGYAVVLTVDTSDWTISKGPEFEFDNSNGQTPALAQIDGAHYLCAYSGGGDDGWAIVLTVDTGDWSVSKETPFEFDTNSGVTPSLCKIDYTHYLCTYQGPGSTGWAVILTVDTANWTLNKGTPFNFETNKFYTPTLEKIDDTNYLCAYGIFGMLGWSVVLTVDTASDTVGKGTLFEFESNQGQLSALEKIDQTHYLCAYTGWHADGWAVILTVNPGDLTITKGNSFEFDDTQGSAPELAWINGQKFLCAYSGWGITGKVVVLTVDAQTDSIGKGAAYIFDSNRAAGVALSGIDNEHFLCTYEGSGSDGWAVILSVGGELRP